METEYPLLLSHNLTTGPYQYGSYLQNRFLQAPLYRAGRCNGNILCVQEEYGSNFYMARLSPALSAGEYPCSTFSLQTSY